jgi:hypothetical protein
MVSLGTIRVWDDWPLLTDRRRLLEMEIALRHRLRTLRIVYFSAIIAIDLVAIQLTRGSETLPHRQPISAETDCGALALYTLLSLEGIGTDLAKIDAALPSRHPEGYSMAELRSAAHQCGLDLIGVKWNKSVRQPDRPLLALLRRGDHGHYVVVRPVGHTGSLVQILDIKMEPLILDATILYAMPEWTGLALIPKPKGSLTHLIIVMATGILVLLSAILVVRRRHFGSRASKAFLGITEGPLPASSSTAS